MAVAKRAAEVIDLTADDDEDENQVSTPDHARVPLPGGRVHTSISLDALGSPHRPIIAHSAELPRKRVRLDHADHRPRHAAQVSSEAVKPFARAAAKVAHHDDPRLDEVVLRQKLHDALCHRFGRQLEQTAGTISGDLHDQMIQVTKEHLQAFLLLPECRSQAAAPFPPRALTSPLAPQPAASVAQSYALFAPNNAPSNTSTHVRPPSTNSWSPPQPRPDSTPGRATNGIVNLTGPPAQEQGAQVGQLQVAYAQAQAQAEAQAQDPFQVPKTRVPHLGTERWRNVSTQMASGPPVGPPPFAAPPTTLPRPSRPSPIPADPRVHNGESSSTPRGLRRRRGVPSTPSSSKRILHNVATSPANYHVRASKAALASELSSRYSGTRHPIASTYFALAHRPYLGVPAQEAILRSNGRLGKITSTSLQKPEVFHVDFTLDEVRKVHSAVRTMFSRPDKEVVDPYYDLQKLLKRYLQKKPQEGLSRVAREVSLKVSGRKEEDIRSLLEDVFTKRVEMGGSPQILSLEKDPYDRHRDDLRESGLSSLLMAREFSGGRGSTRRFENLPNEFRKYFDVELRSEFTNCAGDISTISWVSDDAYVAGTTVHMDSHNQQYNKPGNLVLGSVSRGSAALTAYDDHRIVRPIVERGQNSTDEMRESQDPWLYTSVVSSDHDPIHKRTYTSGFDKRVKIWKVEKTDNLANSHKMRCIGTWEHQGPVNFVQASSFTDDNYGLVATAADVPTEAVRVYRVPKDDSRVAQSPFAPFACSMKRNLDGTPLVTDKWTYFPSTMQWGIEASVKHLLLVGYSPRSLTHDDNDIPMERLNTGELCLWDATSGALVNITGAKTQNVFEVMWHPSLPLFIAATSPIGEGLKNSTVKTQVRIFKRLDNNEYLGGTAFGQIKALDCAADDINELTIIPNSVAFSYVTAGCTDGKAYVWDTALSDKPMQILSHGPAFQGVAAGDDEDDTGVKFTAWGTSLDRFYTGSSDGVVKVWNVRTSGGMKAKGRVILEAPSQISFGAFSPDRSRLIIGDASGRIFILTVDEHDCKPPEFDKFLEKQGIKKRKPNQVTPHPAPSPPAGPKSLTNQQLGHAYVSAKQLRHSGDPTVGMVQDVNYAETGLFRSEAHLDHDPTKEILGHFACRLQGNQKEYANLPVRTRRLRQLEYTSRVTVDPDHACQALLKQHEDNSKLDLQFEELSLEIRDVLARDGIGQRELLEGPEYPGLEEQDDVELQKGKVEIVRDEEYHETHVWV